MLSKLMKPGQYRIDYLNPGFQGNPNALAFYVRSEYISPDPYCIEAKRHLMAGLCLLRQENLEDNLVGIYIDIDGSALNLHPAFNQLLQDISTGLVSRIFSTHPSDLLGNASMRWKLEELQDKVGPIELVWPETLSLSRQIN